MVKKFNINMSKIPLYLEGEEDGRIRRQLRENRLYNRNCLYAVFNGAREKQILKTGNYRKGNPDSIFALTKKELIWQGEIERDNSIKNLAMGYSTPAIAVFDRDKLYKDGTKGDYRWEYFFKNPDKKLEALLGIAFLDFGKPDF